MLKAFIFLSVVYLFSQVSCAEWDDINYDEELGDSSRKAVESSPNTYKFLVYPWQQWNPHFYQPIAQNLRITKSNFLNHKSSQKTRANPFTCVFDFLF